MSPGGPERRVHPCPRTTAGTGATSSNRGSRSGRVVGGRRGGYGLAGWWRFAQDTGVGVVIDPCVAVASKAQVTHRETSTAANPLTPPSIEAGVEPWQLDAPLSRESVVAAGTGLIVLGGISPAGTSLAGVTTLAPTTGTASAGSLLATGVHDAAAVSFGSRTYVLGGGSQDTVATVQSVVTPLAPAAKAAPSAVSGQLPQPRSDLAVATLPPTGTGRRSTTYVVGGYDGSHYLPSVLATTDGTHFRTAASLPVPVRYPAVVADAGRLYAFGGQVPSPGAATVATDDIQMIDPASHRAVVVGHLPQPLYGACGLPPRRQRLRGRRSGPRGSDPHPDRRLRALHRPGARRRAPPPGRCLRRLCHAGRRARRRGLHGRRRGGRPGGERPGRRGLRFPLLGDLAAAEHLRGTRPGRRGPALPSPAPSSSPTAATTGCSPSNTQRAITWQYPSATMPPPPGGFYFPDDAFFIHGGTGIISNQEDNHTIVEIGYPSGKILWQYGHPGQPGAAPGYLDQPDDAYLLKSGTITVADASNNRILFISPQGQVTGQIGNGADAHDPPVSIAYPNGDTPLADGNVLVSEINGSWVDEYTPAGRLVWTVHIPTVNYPSDPQQVGPNLYLMTDYDPPAEGRALEFTRSGQVTWLYDAPSGDAMLKKPSLAERLPNGLIMLNDDYRDRVVVIDPATHSIVWQYGLTDVPGTSPGLVSIPDGFDNLLANGITPTHPVTG